MSSSFEIAKEMYASVGVDVEQGLNQLKTIHLSLPCWQADDVAGLESPCAKLEGGGLAATGNYPGRPRNGEELRMDLSEAIKHIPGPCRINLHACYAERGGSGVDRDQYGPEHFSAWMDWASDGKFGLDFNPTFFSHRLAADHLTLSHPDKGVRGFWIQHAKSCRVIGEAFGQRLGSRCTVNIWIPDGSKDTPADRLGPRERLKESLDSIFERELQASWAEDSLESKLFGIGSESYVVGSHEFYLGYAITRQKILCLDSGHFHPTEILADKISATLIFLPGLLLHLSRGVRWDSDHVVVLDDPTRAVLEEVVRHGLLLKTRLALDFFDASINRVAALIIGARAAKQALLGALLQPHGELRRLEIEGDYAGRLALMERCKLLPLGMVWDEFCAREGKMSENLWLDQVRNYERGVMFKRSD